MQTLGGLYQMADWKKEKHVPAIECPDVVKAGESLGVVLSVGKEIPHPNTTEHHIRWIALYFHPEGDKFPYEIGRYEFSSHGESVQGANQGPAYSVPEVKVTLKLSKAGVLYAAAYCNIHGLWESAKEVKLA